MKCSIKSIIVMGLKIDQAGEMFRVTFNVSKKR